MTDTSPDALKATETSPEALKAEGNAFFSHRAFQQAIDSYSQAIDRLERNEQEISKSKQFNNSSTPSLLAQLYSNRAASYLERNIGQFDIISALSDSSAAIRLSDTFIRAYQRKAAAQLALQPPLINDAIATLQRALMHALDAEASSNDDQSESAAAAQVLTLRNSISSAQSKLANERLIDVSNSTSEKSMADDSKPNSTTPSSLQPSTSPPPTETADDPMLAFFSEIGTLQSEQEQREQERVRIAAETASTIALNANQGLLASINGADGAGSLLQGSSSTLIKTMFSSSTADDDSVEEEKRLEALRKVSTGKEYELIGPAAAIQSAEIANAPLGTAHAQTERLLGPHHQWLRLNPFEVLLLPYTSCDEDIKSRFRKLSTMIHPDKNDHPRAGDAFNEVKQANERLLDPNARRIAAGMFHNAVRALEKKRRKAGADSTSNNAAVSTKLLASQVGAIGPGLPFTDEAMAVAVRAAFAEAENRRRTFEARVKRDNEDKVQEAKDELEKQKVKAQEDKLWSLGREERKQGWQAFIGTIGGKRSREVEGGTNEKEKVKDKDDGGDGQGEIERQAKRSTS
jgi:DnaJ homolog subfamily C member 8